MNGVLIIVFLIAGAMIGAAIAFFIKENIHTETPENTSKAGGMSAEEWRVREEDFKRAVGALTADNGLWPGLIGFLDRHVSIEMEALCQDQIEDTELRRAQGRLGLVLELRSELADYPNRIKQEVQERQARAQKPEGSPVQMATRGS